MSAILHLLNTTHTHKRAHTHTHRDEALRVPKKGYYCKFQMEAALWSSILFTNVKMESALTRTEKCNFVIFGKTLKWNSSFCDVRGQVVPGNPDRNTKKFSFAEYSFLHLFTHSSSVTALTLVTVVWITYLLSTESTTIITRLGPLQCNWAQTRRIP